MSLVRSRRRLALCAALALVLSACGGDDSGGGPSFQGNEDLFTSAGFGEAVDAVSGEAGADAPILRVQVTEGGAEFQLRDGEAATGFIYTGGELKPVEVEIIGGGTLEGLDFPLTEVDPAAIDKITSGVVEASGIDDIEVTVMTLEKQALDGQLRWVINAEGGGRTGLVFNADPDGSNVTSPTGDIAGADAGGSGGGESGGPADVDSAVQDAQEIADCIQAAGTDVEAIQACSE
ncbi:MAG: hypothetical protein FJW90_06885 [Actinobacteria bacterium]|nr:hypothetical protein [Actinomycetota bacterium]